MEVSPALPSTRYAKSGSVHVAYKVFGESHIDLVYVPGFVSNIETYWEEPSFARWLHKLGGFARVIMFDKRGRACRTASKGFQPWINGWMTCEQ